MIALLPSGADFEPPGRQRTIEGRRDTLPHVAVLESHVERTDEHDRRRERMGQLVAELRERTAAVARGGGEKAVERHRSRGKLTARERIDRLVDPGSAFLELSALAAWEVYEGQAPSAGIVTGIGVVSGVECVIIAHDPTVRGGSMNPYDTTSGSAHSRPKTAVRVGPNRSANRPPAGAASANGRP